MKLLSFDIEISDVFELREHEDLEKYAPFSYFVGGNGCSWRGGTRVVFGG